MSDHLIDLAKRAGFTGVRTTWSDVKTSHSTLHNKTYAELARFEQLVREDERKQMKLDADFTLDAILERVNKSARPEITDD